jgi:RNA polymerase sigma factor (sigma-70 family)
MMRGSTDTVSLLRLWHTGDESALHTLLEQHLPDLHRFARQVLDRDYPVLRGEQESLDLVQTAMAKVLAYLPRFVPRDGDQFRALLRTFVRNDLRNQLRSPRWRNARRRNESHDSILDLGPAPSTEMPSRMIEKAEQRAWVRLGLEFLEREDDRLLLYLHVVEQAPWDEIARELELGSPDAARMRYRRSVQPRLANVLRLLRTGMVDELLAKADSS